MKRTETIPNRVVNAAPVDGPLVSPLVSSVATLLASAAIIGCAPTSSYQATSTVPLGHITEYHSPLTISDPNATTSSVTAQVNVGVVYLESQVAPLSVNSLQLQASDVSYFKNDIYSSSNYFDSAGYQKLGTIEHLTPYNCTPNGALVSQYCLNSLGAYQFPQAEIFAAASDGANVYAVGSTLTEDQAPYYGRLYKMSLDGSGTPTAIAQTAVLPSIAGTGVRISGNYVYATSGTSSNASTQGGLRVLNLSDLSMVTDYPLYDARAVNFYSGDPSKMYVLQVPSSGTTNLISYGTAGVGSGTTFFTGSGNAYAQSKSNLVVGNSLAIASLGDQGFKVLCKSTGAVLASVPAVSVSGLPASMTPTNSVAVAPGYIFAADGEAGVYVYTFIKTNPLSSNLCTGGVTVTLLGRLSLTTDSVANVLLNSSLSANSVQYAPIYNLLGTLTAKLVYVSSGNKGISLLNITNLSLLTAAVDDF